MNSFWCVASGLEGDVVDGAYGDEIVVGVTVLCVSGL